MNVLFVCTADSSIRDDIERRVHDLITELPGEGEAPKLPPGPP